MRIHLRLARFLIRLGAFFQSLPVVVLKPDELIDFSRQSYMKPDVIKSWSVNEIVKSGLSANEKDLLLEISEKKGNLLLLGVGGGREAIPLARMGFNVTGVDFVTDMVDHAKANASELGIVMDGLVQDISKLDVPADTYDVVWLSQAMFSCIPTRKRRVEMVRRIAYTLKPGGYFLCQFHRDPRLQLSSLGLLLRRLIALVTLGNLEFENGDTLWLNVEFLHAFASEEDVRSEIEEGGLSVVRIQTNLDLIRCSAVCRKNTE